MTTPPRPLRVCFICDDGYVLPTVAAIQSLKENGLDGRTCDVIVIAADLTPANEQLFRRLETEVVRISVIRASTEKLTGLHRSGSTACVATPAALLKFSLGELLPDLDRVLYLDGDILVRKSLAPLFDTELGDHVLAAAPDTGSLYFRRPICDEVETYFNSGVMLLNLAKMRAEGFAGRLLEAKRNATDHTLMDQDVFNRVCDGHVAVIPPRWNLLLLNLARASAYGNFRQSDFNAAFGTDYADLVQAGEDAAIIHFASKEKPWKFMDVPFACEWRDCLGRSPCADARLPTTTGASDWAVRLDSHCGGADWWRQRGKRPVRKLGLLYYGLANGGIQRTASFHLPMFRRMGLEAVVFANTPLTGEEYDNGGAFELVSLADVHGRPVEHARKLREALLEKGVDLLIYHDAYLPEQLAADIRAAQTADVPVAVFWNSVFSHFLVRPGRQLETKVLFGACRGATMMLTLTRTDEAFFRMYGLPALAIPFSVPDLLPGFRRKDHPHRLLWLGRLVELKQPIQALEILHRVRARFPNAELVLLGDGDVPVRDELDAWLSAHPEDACYVHLEGFKKDVRPYLESCGVGLVTSRFEGFCHSIVEMKMAAMPVVAYEMPYLDTLKPNSGAICVPQGDVNAAADAVVALFESPDEFRRQALLARQSYEELAAVDEEGRYRRIFNWIAGGANEDFTSIDPASSQRAAETFIGHMHEALGIMDRQVREEWSCDRSYRLGRILTWPYRTCKKLMRILV